eukprot:365391-Chlamydomonas_euryale.AAC.13
MNEECSDIGSLTSLWNSARENTMLGDMCGKGQRDGGDKIEYALTGCHCLEDISVVLLTVITGPVLGTLVMPSGWEELHAGYLVPPPPRLPLPPQNLHRPTCGDWSSRSARKLKTHADGDPRSVCVLVTSLVAQPPPAECIKIAYPAHTYL